MQEGEGASPSNDRLFFLLSLTLLGTRSPWNHRHTFALLSVTITSESAPSHNPGQNLG